MLEEFRSGLLFDVQRLAFAVLYAVVVVALDVTVLHFSTFATPADVAEQLAIHGVGLYLGFTLLALFDAVDESPPPPED